jgi:V-type H+-transporting ATPase subunit D
MSACLFYDSRLPTTLVDETRLKKVQGKKKRDADAAEAKRKAGLAELAAQSLESSSAVAATPVVEAPVEDESVPADLLSSKDNDVIF